MSSAQRSPATPWTCAAHILMTGGDHMGGGYILTTDDRMYWDRVYENLSVSCDESAQGTSRP